MIFDSVYNCVSGANNVWLISWHSIPWNIRTRNKKLWITSEIMALGHPCTLYQNKKLQHNYTHVYGKS